MRKIIINHQKKKIKHQQRKKKKEKSKFRTFISLGEDEPINKKKYYYIIYRYISN